MTPQPFHHGNLRAVLLDEATTVVRESGVAGLSLRDLARRAGVSHGAPRSHFPDRGALLDALAERGFDRLTAAVRRALSGEGGLRARLERVAHAYVDFAVDDSALMELMFETKTTGRPGQVQEAAGALFEVLDGALGPPPVDGSVGASRDTFKMLFAATMQGIASLIASGRLERGAGDRLVDAAMDTLLTSDLAALAVTAR
jgi:AcrR family transcriptional regulator